ncbi:xanthine dehydrogenase family Fe-S subunit [Methylobacterium sp. JK268]
MTVLTAPRDGLLSVSLTVNDAPVRLAAEPRTHLADLVRDGLGLTGTHLGCEHGVCGACTLLLDGEPARGCLTLAGACAGARVTTIEGLDGDAIAAELRTAFNREHALQCGYCTPGMLVTARDLVRRLPDADERRIRVGLSGNLCRCTGYAGIVRAVAAVITERRARGIAPETGGERALGPVGGRVCEDRAGQASSEDPVPRSVRLPPLSRTRAASAEGDPGTSTATRREAAPSAGTVVDKRPLRVVSRWFPDLLPLRSSRPEKGEERAARGEDTPVDLPDSFTPDHAFAQTLALSHPPEAVFALFGDVEAVAACLPGAVLTARPTPDRVEGGLSVRIGPIGAVFRGQARIAQDSATLSGHIRGAGRDAGGRSATEGQIRYRVGPGAAPGTARVDLAVGYTLKGPLAQFGRPGLVRDLAGRLAAEFARNVEARLAGRAAPARPLNPLRLLLAALTARFGPRR